VGDTVLCNGILKRVGAFVGNLRNSANVCSPMPHRSGRTEFFSRPQ